MKIKFTLLAAIVASIFVSCGDNTEKIAEGIVMDATMNTMTIIDAKGDTVVFSTMDADRAGLNNLLIGDSAWLTYKGELKIGVSNINTAVKAVNKPAPVVKDEVIGSWIEPIPGQEGAVQGITINEDGTVASINMTTLTYEKWSRDNGVLILSGKSIGNKQTIEFTDTLAIAKLDADSLVLSGNKVVLRYGKQK